MRLASGMCFDIGSWGGGTRRDLVTSVKFAPLIAATTLSRTDGHRPGRGSPGHRLCRLCSRSQSEHESTVVLLGTDPGHPRHAARHRPAARSGRGFRHDNIHRRRPRRRCGSWGSGPVRGRVGARFQEGPAPLDRAPGSSGSLPGPFAGGPPPRGGDRPRRGASPAGGAERAAGLHEGTPAEADRGHGPPRGRANRRGLPPRRSAGRRRPLAR